MPFIKKKNESFRGPFLEVKNLQSCLIPWGCWFKKMTRQKKCSSLMQEMEGFLWLLMLLIRWHVIAADNITDFAFTCVGFPWHWSEHFRKNFSCKNFSLSLIWSLLQELFLQEFFLATDLTTFSKTSPCRWSHFCKNSWAPLESWAASAAFSGQPPRCCCLWWSRLGKNDLIFLTFFILLFSGGETFYQTCEVIKSVFQFHPGLLCQPEGLGVQEQVLARSIDNLVRVFLPGVAHEKRAT